MATATLKAAKTGSAPALRLARNSGMPAISVLLHDAPSLLFEVSWRATAGEAIDAKATSPDVAGRLGALVSPSLDQSADGRGASTRRIRTAG